jgi:hypothetical protein
MMRFTLVDCHPRARKRQSLPILVKTIFGSGT